MTNSFDVIASDDNASDSEGVNDSPVGQVWIEAVHLEDGFGDV